MLAQSKNCLACDKPVKGRTDKKFCDDFCRNKYNNQLKAGCNNYVRNINNALGKNRRILESLQSLAAGGRIILLITHNKRSLQYCGRSLSIHE